MKHLKYGNFLAILLLLGCSGGSTQNPSAPGPGAGTGLFVAGCNFSSLDQNYAFDIVVSGSDNVAGQGRALRATIYDRPGSIQGVFAVEVIPGSTASRLLETIQSVNDGGASFKVEISNTVSTGAYTSNLVHASLADGSQINSRGLLCKTGL